MTEAQRVITKYVQDLSRPICVQYHLHFLRDESDAPARQMLLQNIRTYERDSGNQRLASYAASVPSSLLPTWADESEKLPSESEPEPYGMTPSSRARDPAQTARTQIAALRLRAALASLEQAKRDQSGSSYVNGYYRERLEIHLVYQNWAEALSLALKSGKSDAIFLCAIAAGEFAIAAQYIPAIRARVSSASREKEVLASLFELTHLLVYVALATKSTEDTKDLIETIRTVPTFDLPDLLDFAGLFAARNFSRFWAKTHEWAKRPFRRSYYANAAREKLEKAIQVNIVRNAAEPYGNVAIAQLASTISCDEGFVVMSLQALIRDGRIKGALDLVAMRFFGNEDTVEYEELLDTLDRTVIAKERLARILWQVEYGEKIAQIKRRPNP